MIIYIEIKDIIIILHNSYIYIMIIYIVIIDIKVIIHDNYTSVMIIYILIIDIIMIVHNNYTYIIMQAVGIDVRFQENYKKRLSQSIQA